MKKTITLFSIVLSCLTANAQKCLSSLETNFIEKPASKKEFEHFNSYTQQFIANRNSTSSKTSSIEKIIIPVVFHIYGRTQNGKSITDQKIINSLNMVNEDFQGLNSDFYTVDPLFTSIRSSTNITFKLAQIDPNGNPTNGIIDHPESAGQGNYNSSIVTQDAWDNYKYMNIYITADLKDDGVTTNSGVAWYPDTVDSDAKKARVVYNGQYLKGNTDDEFASVLTHEFGHWLNLLHTFEGGCTSINQDYVDDTPQEDYNAADDGCIVGATDCGNSLINYENYMGYDSSTGCAKMFTKGQTDRMYAALHHPARFTLWQNQNLIDTGVGSSFTVTPYVKESTTWQQTNELQVCEGANISLGMQNVNANYVAIIKPNGLTYSIAENSDATATYWSLNNVQSSDAGTYLIYYNDTNGNIGFTPITLKVGYTLNPWVKNSSGNWYNQNKLVTCAGTNISLGMQNLGVNNASIEYPNGTIDNTPDLGTAWNFNNVTVSDAGVYTITYNFGNCTASVDVELIIGEEIRPWVKQGSTWYNQDYVEACVGENVTIGMQNIGTNNVTLTYPNGTIDTTPDLGTGFEFTNLQNSDFGTYTITWNNPSGCTGSKQIELKYKNNAIDGWVRDNANNWIKSTKLTACPGDNIALGTANLGTQNFKITYPNGTVDTTPDLSTAWFLNNIQESDQGTYKIEYNNGFCYSRVDVTLLVSGDDISNTLIQYQKNLDTFTTSATNSVTVSEGDKIILKIPENIYDGTITWTGPNGYLSSTNTALISNSFTSNNVGTYTATINHNNPCGGSSSTALNFTINLSTLSSDAISLNNSFFVYPNPTNNKINIHSKNININKVEIFNLSGKVLLDVNKDQLTLNKNLIDIGNYSSGIYFLKIYSSKGIAVKKVIKH